MTAIDAPRAGRREWVGLAVLALACLPYVIGAVLAVGIAILAVVMLRNVGSGADREAASDPDAEADRPDDVDRPRHELRPTRVVTPEA